MQEKYNNQTMVLIITNGFLFNELNNALLKLHLQASFQNKLLDFEETKVCKIIDV